MSLERNADFYRTKLYGCVRLARECRRNIWQNATATQALEYRRISRECMQDAREYARELRSVNRMMERLDDQRRAYGRSQRGEELNQ